MKVLQEGLNALLNEGMKESAGYEEISKPGLIRR